MNMRFLVVASLATVVASGFSLVPSVVCGATESQVGEVRTYRGIRPDSPHGREGLLNPERGWRFEIGVGQLPNDVSKFRHVRDGWPFPRYKKDGVTLAHATCYLPEFHASPISEEKLAALQADFDHAREEGCKFVLRFAYEGLSQKFPPPTLDRVLAHIGELTPIIRRNIDVIYVLETGWLGAWGELHSSATGLDQRNPKAVAEVVKATLNMLPEDRFTSVRCMRYKTWVLKLLGDSREITAATAFTAAPHARIGFHNDGTLANETDGGTFLTAPFAAFGNPEFDLAARESPFMPVDGELYWSAALGTSVEFANGLKAIRRFHDLHYSSFSLVHGFSELDMNPIPFTIDAWKTTPVTAEEVKKMGADFDPDYFAGVPSRTAFEFIRDHLGYRLKLETLRLVPVSKGQVRATARIVNLGFGTPINKRQSYFVLVGANGACREFPTDIDCRRLVCGTTQELSAEIPKPKSGERLALWFPDSSPSIRLRPEYAIRLANDMRTEIVGGRLLHLL